MATGGRTAQAAEASTSARAAAWSCGLAGQLVAAGALAVLAGVSFRTCELYESEELICRDVIAKNPDSWIAYSSLGVQLALHNRYDESLAASRRALELAPDRARVHHNYASTLVERGARHGFQTGDVDDAIAHYQRAIEISPELAAHYLGLGRALMPAERYDEAAKSLQRAVEIEPHNFNAWRTLGEAQQKIGEWDQSRRSFEMALSIQPGRAESHFGLATALATLGKVRPAVAEFEEAIRLRPDYVAAWQGLARGWADLGEADRQIECLREVARLDPSAEAQENLTQALQRRSTEDKSY